MRTESIRCFRVRARLFLALVLIAGMGSPPLLGQWEPGKDVSYVPTPSEVVEAMLKLAEVKSGDFVIDLGCGDGRMVVMAAARFGARGKGVDFNPTRVQEAKANARKAGVADRVEFVQGDLFEADIRAASVVMLYLLPSVNLRLRPKLLRELKVGTRIVSHSFDMGDWQSEKIEEPNGRIIRLWTVTEEAKTAFGEQ